jgi:NAD-dependent dihydropyrimidine dehydrogenase PreA subunit
MAGKYHIQTHLADTKFRVLGKYAITRSDECVNCGICIEACIYEVHHRQDIAASRNAPRTRSACP